MAPSAKLLFRSRFVYADGGIREMVLWRLPQPTEERPHGLKYRLYYSSADGRSMVRYDNETGKGDHRHRTGGGEEAYHFRGVEILLDDFLKEIDRMRGAAVK